MSVCLDQLELWLRDGGQRLTHIAACWCKRFWTLPAWTTCLPTNRVGKQTNHYKSHSPHTLSLHYSSSSIPPPWIKALQFHSQISGRPCASSCISSGRGRGGEGGQIAGSRMPSPLMYVMVTLKWLYNVTRPSLRRLRCRRLFFLCSPPPLHHPIIISINIMAEDRHTDDP